MLLRIAMLVWTVALLAACGGGGDDDMGPPDLRGIPTPVDCAAHPELCK